MNLMDIYGDTEVIKLDTDDDVDRAFDYIEDI